MVPRGVVPTGLDLHTDGALDVYRWHGGQPQRAQRAYERDPRSNSRGVRATGRCGQRLTMSHTLMWLKSSGLAPHRTLVSREQHTVNTLIGYGCDAHLIPIEQAAVILAPGHRSRARLPLLTRK